LWIPALAAVSLFQPAELVGQQPFRTKVSIVAIYATVQDRQGGLVTDLAQSDFEVLDDGKPVELTLFRNEAVPITAVLLFDTSGSVTEQSNRLFSATSEFIGALWPSDRLRIGSFADEVSLSPLLTNDKRVLLRILNEVVWPGFTTALWQGLDSAITSLAGEQGRRVVIALTDGYYSPSNGGIPPLPGGAPRVKKRAAEDSDLMVYTIWSRQDSRDHGLSPDMVELSQLTGGGHLILPHDADLRLAMVQLANELRHQYVLGFSPARMDGKQHKLEVRLLRPGMTPRSRTSYLAVEKQP